MPGLFTALALLISLPAAIVTLSFSKKVNGFLKILVIFLSIVTIGLVTGTLVNGILGMSIRREYGHHPCSWVCLGLSCGSMLFAVLSIVSVFTSISYQRKNPGSNAQRGSGSNYIEEIKALKQLLDIGAITQEEFDTKKAKLLE